MVIFTEMTAAGVYLVTGAVVLLLGLIWLHLRRGNEQVWHLHPRTSMGLLLGASFLLSAFTDMPDWQSLVFFTVGFGLLAAQRFTRWLALLGFAGVVASLWSRQFLAHDLVLLSGSFVLFLLSPTVLRAEKPSARVQLWALLLLQACVAANFLVWAYGVWLQHQAFADLFGSTWLGAPVSYALFGVMCVLAVLGLAFFFGVALRASSLITLFLTFLLGWHLRSLGMEAAGSMFALIAIILPFLAYGNTLRRKKTVILGKTSQAFESLPIAR